jgi:PBP1b-binding outer membrane lipoprotein LpoB
MKKTLIPISAAISTALLLSGCLGLHFGGGTKTSVQNKSQTYNVTLGQQLIDLQKAYQAGIITESEYNAQKKKLLRHYGDR